MFRIILSKQVLYRFIFVMLCLCWVVAHNPWYFCANILGNDLWSGADLSTVYICDSLYIVAFHFWGRQKGENELGSRTLVENAGVVQVSQEILYWRTPLRSTSKTQFRCLRAYLRVPLNPWWVSFDCSQVFDCSARFSVWNGARERSCIISPNNPIRLWYSDVLVT